MATSEPERLLAHIIGKCFAEVLSVIHWHRPMTVSEVSLRLTTEITDQCVELRKVSPCDCVLETSRCCVKCPIDLSKEAEIETIKTAAMNAFHRVIRGWPEFRYDSRHTVVVHPDDLDGVLDIFFNNFKK
jgi:hypothetical protein